MPAPGASQVRRRRWEDGLTEAAVWVLGAVVLFGCYLRLSLTVPVNSDGASNALQAWDMLHGNLLLHGWWLSDVSFYTTELPQYMLVELARGLNTSVVHIAGAMTYTLVVALAALLARGRVAPGRAGRRPALIRAAIVVAIMLAPQAGLGATVLLLSPDHVGTAVPVMLALLILDRARPRWPVPVIVGVVLAWALVADSLVLYIGIMPIALVCLARAYQGCVTARQPLARQWYPLALAAAMMLAVVAAMLAGAVLRSSGGYLLSTQHLYFAKAGSMPRHLAIASECLLLLFGADFYGQRLGLSTGIELVHLVAVALACWAMAIAVRRFGRPGGLLIPVLAVAIILNLGGFVFGTLVFNPASAREIAPVLPFGAVLAARLLAARLLGGAGDWAAGDWVADDRVADDRVARARLAPLLLAGVLVCAVGLAHTMVQPAVPAAGGRLASWLARHQLRHGLAGYWLSSSTTLASRGRVQVRPVCYTAGTFTRDQWEAKASWYATGHASANFMVVGLPSFCDDASAKQAASAFGPPMRTYRYGSLRVLVWNKDLLRALRPARVHVPPAQPAASASPPRLLKVSSMPGAASSGGPAVRVGWRRS